MTLSRQLARRLARLSGIDIANRKPWLLLAALALLSGAGLAVLVVLSLLRAGEQARAQQELDARQNARAMAQTVRAVLRQHSVLELVPPGERFALAGGRVVVPDAVGWLDELPALPPDPVVAAKADLAARAEFVARDAAAAAATFDDLLDERGPRGRARLPVLAAATWQAQRAGDAARRDRLLGELREALAQRTPAELALPELAVAVAACALLDAAVGADVQAPAATLMPALPAAVATPLLLRLAERGSPSPELAEAQRAVAKRRAVLHTVARELERSPLSPRAVGDRLLLWFPGDAPGHGDGALCDPAALAARLLHPSAADVPQVPDLGEQVFGGSTGDAREPVVDGLWWIAPRAAVAEVPLLAQPIAAFAAAAALLLVLLGSGLFAGRALRQQAQALALRAQFVTVVTHELKTPLAAIRLLAEMLVEGRAPAGKARDYYRLLAGEAARLSMLIDNVLDLGRMERGERAYDRRACDLREVLDEAVTLFAPIAEREGLQLRVRAADVPAPACADRGALLQALLNVLDNGRKYGAAGGAIEVAAGPLQGRFELRVRDFGPGVPAAERGAIFGKFQRGAAQQHGSIPGVGLGLHLSRAILRHHGGDLSCRAPDDGGAGAEFAFTLPLAPAPTEVRA